MNRPRVVRYLRIAISASCLIACVLLIALWVRSYYRNDRIIRSSKASITLISSNRGLFHVEQAWPYRGETQWERESSRPHTDHNPAFAWMWLDTFRSVQCPIWFLLLPGASFGVTPWVRWRFSLRTLLIATTLVAVVLGLFVWHANVVSRAQRDAREAAIRDGLIPSE